MVQGAEKKFIESRVNLPTDKGSAEIARDIPAVIRARAFFSARVAEAHILERFREISDRYSSGEISRDEARHLLRQFARSEGKDDGTQSLRNLASTARLNLILDQNAKMARAVGQYEAMHRPANLQMFPYVIYRASVGSKHPRGSHSQFDGKIIAKDDPWLKTHWPPWEFGCNCDLQNCTAKKAAGLPGLTDEDRKVASQGGFEFDPSTAFEEFDCSVIQRAGMMGKVREEAEIEFGSQISFKNGKASFEDKGFHTFEDEGRGSALLWKNENLPQAPGEYSVEKAKKMLQAGTRINAATGETVVFDAKCLYHWQVEEEKTQAEIDSRLAYLSFAVSTVVSPLEVWDQGTQKAFIKAFKKTTGKIRGCLVFVLPDMTVKTYFLKDLKGVDKARKGFTVQTFAMKENGAD